VGTLFNIWGNSTVSSCFSNFSDKRQSQKKCISTILDFICKNMVLGLYLSEVLPKNRFINYFPLSSATSLSRSCYGLPCRRRTFVIFSIFGILGATIALYAPLVERKRCFNLNQLLQTPIVSLSLLCWLQELNCKWNAKIGNSITSVM
jgi:hypothetical protein